MTVNSVQKFVLTPHPDLPAPRIYLRIAHGLHGAVISGPQRGEVNQHINLRVLFHGISHVLEDRDQDFLVSPVKLLLVIPTEGKRKSKDTPIH